MGKKLINKLNPSGLDATSQGTIEGLWWDERWRRVQCLSMFSRYSDGTIEAVEMLDTDEKIDLELILALIRHIVLNEGVRVIASPVSAQPGIGFPFLKYSKSALRKITLQAASCIRAEQASSTRTCPGGFLAVLLTRSALAVHSGIRGKRIHCGEKKRINRWHGCLSWKRREAEESRWRERGKLPNTEWL